MRNTQRTKIVFLCKILNDLSKQIFFPIIEKGYIRMTNFLQYQEALELYTAMTENLNRNDEDIVDLYNRLIEKAVRYAHIRAEWNTLNREEKLERDSSRTAAHDSFIASVNIISRTEGEIGSQWRERLGNSRKRVGDFACYISLFLSLEAR